MNVHLVAIAYGLADDLSTLFEAAVSERHDLSWHLFLHSRFEDVVAVCMGLSQRDDVIYYPYGENRGLARSWNQGIVNGYNAGAEVVIIVNDDMVPAPGDLDRLAEGAVAMRDRYVVTCQGYEVRHTKQVSTAFGFTVINPLAVQVLGMFDENYFPIYGEDADYRQRAKLAGLEMGMVVDTQVKHQGSKSIHTVPGLMAQNKRTYEATLAYQMRKWGGHYGQERYEHPFNDPAIGLRIDPAPEVRHAPYPGHNRTDHSIVKF